MPSEDALARSVGINEYKEIWPKTACSILTARHSWPVCDALRDRRLRSAFQTDLCLSRRGDPLSWPWRRRVTPETANQGPDNFTQPTLNRTLKTSLTAWLPPKGDATLPSGCNEPSR